MSDQITASAGLCAPLTVEDTLMMSKEFRSAFFIPVDRSMIFSFEDVACAYCHAPLAGHTRHSLIGIWKRRIRDIPYRIEDMRNALRDWWDRQCSC